MVDISAPIAAYCEYPLLSMKKTVALCLTLNSDDMSPTAPTLDALLSMKFIRALFSTLIMEFCNQKPPHCILALLLVTTISELFLILNVENFTQIAAEILAELPLNVT